jgi:hypothetical protein
MDSKFTNVAVRFTVMVGVDTGPPVEVSVRCPVYDPGVSEEGSAVTVTGEPPVVPEEGLAESQAESELRAYGSAAPDELTFNGALTGKPPAPVVSEIVVGAALMAGAFVEAVAVPEATPTVVALPDLV